ncbi:MAG: tetratricopeptide repeat protein [Nitrospira sp.]|nr:tetratricopeptide repeat protein [Nitrospira sp.]
MALDRAKVLQQAQTLAVRGHYERAVNEWKKLAAESPHDGSIYNSMGDLHLKRNALPDAVACFLKAAEAFKCEGAILKAIAAYKKVLKCDPTKYEVYQYMGDLNVERGLISSAVQDYHMAAKHYLKARRLQEALALYQKIIAIDPSNLSAQQRIAELCLQDNQREEAIKAYLQLGRQRSAENRHQEAKEAYQAVLNLDLQNSEAVQYLEGFKSGKFGATALPSAQDGGTLSWMPGQLGHLAEAVRRMDEKEYDGAEAILNQMLSREPGNPQVCQLLARLHLQRGDLQVALGEYRFLAGAALRARDYRLAESLITEFLSYQPTSIPLLELYGELYEEQNDPASAAAQYAKAIELLLAHPEPGMEEYHEELFEKVRALSPDKELVERLAAQIRGEGAAPIDRASSSEIAGELSEPSTICSTTCAEEVANSALRPIHDETQDDRPSCSSTITPCAEPMSLLEPSASKETPPVAEQPSLPLPHTDDEHGETNGYGLVIKPVLLQRGQEAVKEVVQTNEVASKKRGLFEPGFLKGEAPGAGLSEESPSINRGFQGDEPLQSGSEPMLHRMESAAQAVSSSDALAYEAHFALGVAYKNMELYAAAREEFDLVRRVNMYYLDASLMTALCFKEENQLAEAIRELEILVADSRCRGAKAQAIRYELGLLYEADAQWEKATAMFEAIPLFHDVPERLTALKKKRSVAVASARQPGAEQSP